MEISNILEPGTAFTVILVTTAIVSLFLIFAGCNAHNPEFDIWGNGADSTVKQCEKYKNEIGNLYQSCINKKEAKAFACSHYFGWLRY